MNQEIQFYENHDTQKRQRTLIHPKEGNVLETFTIYDRLIFVTGNLETLQKRRDSKSRVKFIVVESFPFYEVVVRWNKRKRTRE